MENVNNNKRMRFINNKLIITWVVISALLAGFYAMFFSINIGNTFFAFINVVNGMLFALVLIFRQKIETAIESIVHMSDI